MASTAARMGGPHVALRAETGAGAGIATDADDGGVAADVDVDAASDGSAADDGAVRANADTDANVDVATSPGAGLDANGVIPNFSVDFADADADAEPSEVRAVSRDAGSSSGADSCGVCCTQCPSGGERTRRRLAAGDSGGPKSPSTCFSAACVFVEGPA